MRSGRGEGRGRAAQRGCGGKGGRGGRSTPAIGAPPTATPPPMTEASMVARIEQLGVEACYHGKFPTSITFRRRGFHMASVAQIEVPLQ